MPDRTYRRADGELIYGEYSTVDSPEFFDDTDEPTEVVEEEWALMRSRTRILGPKGLCVACQGEGVLATWSPTTLTLCGVCDGSGEQPERLRHTTGTDAVLFANVAPGAALGSLTLAESERFVVTCEAFVAGDLLLGVDGESGVLEVVG